MIKLLKIKSSRGKSLFQSTKESEYCVLSILTNNNTALYSCLDSFIHAKFRKIKTQFLLIFIPYPKYLPPNYSIYFIIFYALPFPMTFSVATDNVENQHQRPQQTTDSVHALLSLLFVRKRNKLSF